MPYQRLKSDSFSAFGGINMKSSAADLSIMEFADISNFDFTSTGALQQRPGSATFIVGPALSATTIYSQTFFTLNIGITIGSFTLAASTGATFIGGNVASIYEFNNLNGVSFLMFTAQGGFNYSGTSLMPSLPIGSFTMGQIWYTTGATFNYLLDPMGLYSRGITVPINKNWSFTAFNNRVWMANGDSFFKWDGFTAFIGQMTSITFGTTFTTGVTLSQWQYSGDFFTTPSVYKYCLPPPSYLGFSIISSGATYNFTSTTLTYSVGFINERGFFGPVTPPITVSGFSNFAINLIGFSINGTSFPQLGGVNNAAAIGWTVPLGFGIGCTQITSYVGISGTVQSGGQANIAVYRDNGPGTGRYLLGYAYSAASIGLPNYYTVDFQDFGLTTGTIPEPTCIYATLPPQFLEIYQNQMFMCGFSQAPSTVQFSDIGQPESIQPQNNFDVRTNDGDYLTGLKSAFGQLFFFKNKSFHVLSGDNPQNFVLQPISDQYGCLSNRAIAYFNNIMMFLDKKGICTFNGAQVSVASSKLDPIFANMNLPAAANNAWMLHNKERNQVWCGIPVNGSTQINQIIVYDYLLNAWTHFDGLNIECGSMAYWQNSYRNVFFGGYSSALGYFSPSLTSDSGNAITLMAKSRFMADMGQSVAKMWRRLFINQISAIGATITWNVNFYADYQSIISATIQHIGLTFQTRTDFGIPAKALQIQFYTSTTSDILTLTGFTVESRFQRGQ